MKKFLLCMCVFICSGCASTIPYWVRRSAVHNDWVYVKSTNIAYRRYIPRGIRLDGNKKLKDVGSITAWNNKVVVYSSYDVLIKYRSECIIDKDSKKWAK